MKSGGFEEVLEEVGGMGRYQVLVVMLLGVSLFPVGSNHMANVFLAGLPVFHCATGQQDNATMVTQGYNASARSGGNSSLLMGSGSADTQPACYVTDGNSTEPCTQFDYETDVYTSTIATEWDLVCGEEWKLALTQSVYMLGVLIGAIVFGNLSDIIGRKSSFYYIASVSGVVVNTFACIGRKSAFYISLVLMIVTSCSAAFMPQYWMFTAMRFLVGATACGVITVGFVHTMEVLGKDHRITVGIMYQGWFAVGYIMLAVVAYFIRDYRYIQLAIGLFSILYLPYWCLLGESPRWLLAEGRHEEGVREVKKAARMNRRQVPASLLTSEMTAFTDKKGEDEKSSKQNHTIVVLLKTPNLRRKTLNTCFQWLVISMIYYGLSLGVSALAGGPYLNLVLSGLMEFPGYIIAVLVLDRVGRRIPLSGFNLIGGISCIAMACVPPEYGAIVTGFSLLGKLAISASFALIYVYSAELFPTVVRTLGVGSGSMCARVGSLLSPFIALLGKYWKPLPYLIFGVFSITAGLLALLLPETAHQPLPETIEDGESFGKNAHKQIFKLRHTASRRNEENGKPC